MRMPEHNTVEHFAAQASDVAPGWLRGVRADALAQLRAYGFPSRRDDAWWNTPSHKILVEPYLRADGVADLSSSVELPGGSRVVWVDGRFDAARSTDVHGVQPLSVAPDAAEGHLGALLPTPTGFDALNTALAGAGAVAQLDTTLDAPVHLVHVSTGAGRLGVLRHTIQVAPGVDVTLVEHWLGDGDGTGLTSGVTEVIVGDGATVRWVKIQAEPSSRHHVATVVAQVGADATFAAHSVALGGAISRTSMRVELRAAGSRCELHGLTLLGDRQHADHHVLVDHVAGRATSTQAFRGILADRAHSVFTGKVVVREHAHETDSAQTNHNLLLSDHAVAGTRPQLEIYNDDVVCAHGATVGRLDDEALFYLRARGLAPAEARQLLVTAFATELVQAIPAVVRPAVAAHVDAWLEART